MITKIVIMELLQDLREKMVSMNISLTDELEKYVLEQVQSGMYHSNSEVIRDALRLLKRLTSSSNDLRAWYNSQIDVALRQAENGDVAPGEESYARMKETIAEIGANFNQAAS